MEYKQKETVRPVSTRAMSGVKLNINNTPNQFTPSFQRQTTLNTANKQSAQTFVNNSTMTSTGNHIKTKTGSEKKDYTHTSTYSSTPKAKTPRPLNTDTSILKNAKNSIKDNLRNQDDRTSTIATAITVGEVAIKTFKTAQDFSPNAVKAVRKTGRGLYDISGKTVRVVRKVDSTVAKLQTGQLQLNHDTYLQLKSVARCKILNSDHTQRLQHSVNGLKTGVANTIDTARYLSTQTKYYYQSVKRGTIKTAKVTRGLLNGSVSLKIDKSMLDTIKKASLRGFYKGGMVLERTLKKGAKIGLKTTWGGGKYVVKRGYHNVRGGYKGLKTGVVKAGDFLSTQDDMGVQALGLGIKSARYTVKTVKATPNIIKGSTRSIKTTVSVPVKTVKGIVRFGSGVGKYGLKTTIAFHRAKALKVIQKAGGSVVNALLGELRKILMKSLIPLIIILLVLLCSMNLLVSSSAGTYQVLFGWTSTDKDTGQDVDEQIWLTQKITQSRANLVQEIKKIRNTNLVENGGKYHYVRLFNSFSDSEIELTDTNILSNVYSLNEYYEYIQPIFHVMLLSKYELEETQSEMTDLYNEIWNKLTIVKTNPLPIEYCGGATSPCGQCGSYHADITSCPNYTSGTHSSYTCSSCCYHQSHEDTHTHPITGKKETSTYTTDECNGWYHCDGHKILGITVTVGSFSDLLNAYFLNEINELESKSSLTADESKRLEELKENYEICINYVETMDNELGLSNGTVVNLDGVTLTQVTEFACKFVGNPYVYGGTDINNGIDCSAFVRYVYAHFGVSLPRTSREQVKHGSVVPSLSEAQAGDLIFYSDDGTLSGIHHVTMYLGNGKMVHASNSKPYPMGGIKISNVYGSPIAIRRVAN